MFFKVVVPTLVVSSLADGVLLELALLDDVPGEQGPTAPCVELSVKRIDHVDSLADRAHHLQFPPDPRIEALNNCIAARQEHKVEHRVPSLAVPNRLDHVFQYFRNAFTLQTHNRRLE